MVPPEQPQPRANSPTRAFRPAPGIHDASPTNRVDKTAQPSPSQAPVTSTGDPTRSKMANDFKFLDGSPRLFGVNRFLRDPPGSSTRSPSESPFRLNMPYISPGQLAFSAMQYLPVPMIVLNNLKTVVLANEAMGRMLGIVSEDSDDDDGSATFDRLRGQTLSQVGIDMLQDGRLVWVTWESFLDTLVEEMGCRAPCRDSRQHSPFGGDATPTASTIHSPERRQSSASRRTQDAVVEVVVSQKDIGVTTFDSRYKSKESEYQVFAKMIITIWEVEDRQTFFTLTFTNTQSTPSSIANTKKSIARSSLLEAADRKSISNSNPSSVASSRESSSPSFHSPGIVTMSSSPFPPMGPPSVASHSSTPSVLQKMLLMKDALLDNTQMPILAMWKDGSLTFPNRACRSLFENDSIFDSSLDGFDLLKFWHLYTEDFSRRLDVSEYPISILIRTEQPFSGNRVGMYDENGKKVVYDVLGEAIRDDNTGEFLAGVVTGRDVTVITEEISMIKERDEERFRLICDTMPQLVWTAKPDGMHDFFNTRWFTYTGLTPEQSLGKGWKAPFHPEDMDDANRRWQHSLATGDSYMTEYRCRSKDGEWRWFLGRALPLRNKETGKIDKWFGTCTDVHEGIQTKMNAKRTRQQLLSVIAHSHVTLFTVDPQRRVTMLEGALIWDRTHEENLDGTKWFVGKNMYAVFSRLAAQLADGDRPDFLQPIELILDGKKGEDLKEHGFDDRWYRTRFLPMYGKKTQEGKLTSESCIEGVIGVIMDVTELKNREEALQKQSKEKRKAMANEAAAKEANRLKSQFLANMSHEIRTPITGVLGMAELLAGMELDPEQQEYVENIQSSATSLLTVINDILDFSKVESGRLDIEEVQFSLSLIVKEVGRMLQFAVERKNLDFRADIGGDIENDLVVIGDPGRVRQILTNLLTNSIKFTNQGYVKFSVVKEKETTETVEIKFTVEDTGIGIQDDVRKKLFQPFSQGDSSTARRFGGTGLGLTICKNLLDLMHGRITLESNADSGTTATFWVPFNKPQGRSDGLARAGAIPDRLQSELSMSCNSSEFEHILGTPPTSDPGQPGPARRPRSVFTPSSSDPDLPQSERAKMHVLVVEDNPINQQIATKTIGKLGFQVTAAWNGKEALEYLLGATKGSNPKPDIILMDVQMPIIDGYKCTHLLRHHLPFKSFIQDVPIVAMTASAIQGDREKCTRAGMDDYLAKPVRSGILEKMLIRWCHSRRKDTSLPDPTASDCSGMSEHCDNADIPQVGIDENDMPQIGRESEEYNSPITPRPLTTNGRHEPSPFDDVPTPQIRQPEGEQEWSSMLQETKLIDAAGGPSSAPQTYRSNSYQERQTAGDSLTEENVNKLKRENQEPRR
ncbi:Fc.00g019540.m01.CDS01 [Cosmosporella sp. VM-42]